MTKKSTSVHPDNHFVVVEPFIKNIHLLGDHVSRGRIFFVTLLSTAFLFAKLQTRKGQSICDGIGLGFYFCGCFLSWITLLAPIIHKFPVNTFPCARWVFTCPFPSLIRVVSSAKRIFSHGISALITLGIGLMLVSSTFDHKCNRDYFFWKRTQCDDYLELQPISPDLMLLVTLSPSYFAWASPGIWPFLVSWVLSFVCILITVFLSSNEDFVLYPVYSVWIGLSLVDVILKSRKADEGRIDQFRLRSQARILSQLIGNVIHDLLTPMQALEMGVDTMESMTNPRDDESRDLLQSMKGTLSLMSMIVHRCMDVFQASDGSTLTPNYETFDYTQSVSRVGRFMASMQTRIRIDLKFMRGLNRTEIYTDKSWFEDNILCVMSNAVKFSTHVPGVQVELKVFPSKNLDKTGNLRKMLTVEVWDCGIDMEADARKKLFDMPVMNERNQMGGAGLGLFSMAKRVDALGGLIGSRNRNDGVCPGSVFWFAVPCDKRDGSGSKLGPRWSGDEDMMKRQLSDFTVFHMAPIEESLEIESGRDDYDYLSAAEQDDDDYDDRDYNDDDDDDRSGDVGDFNSPGAVVFIAPPRRVNSNSHGMGMSMTMGTTTSERGQPGHLARQASGSDRVKSRSSFLKMKAPSDRSLNLCGSMSGLRGSISGLMSTGVSPHPSKIRLIDAGTRVSE